MLPLIHTSVHNYREVLLSQWCNANRASLSHLVLKTDLPLQQSSCFDTPVFCFRYKAIYNYMPQNIDELELREGDIVQVMEKCDDGWFVGNELWL